MGVPDATFHDNMRRLQDSWMDQTGEMRDATHEDTMKKSKAKCDFLVNSGKWGAKSPDHEKIIALKAQVKELKDLTLSAQLMNKLKQGQKGKDQQNHKIGTKVEPIKIKTKEELEDGIRRTGQTTNSRSKTRSGRRFLPRMTNRSKNEWESRHFTGVSTT